MVGNVTRESFSPLLLYGLGNRIPELGVERRGPPCFNLHRPDSLRNMPFPPVSNPIAYSSAHAGFNMAVVQRESGGFPVQWEDRGL
jgi:hypothetical protein